MESEKFTLNTKLGFLSLLFLVIYILFPSQNYIYADDSLQFGLYVLEGTNNTANTAISSFTHHLILYVLHWFTKIAHINDFQGALSFTKFYVSCTSALGLFFIGKITYSRTTSVYAAYGAMLTVAFTFCWWSYSIISDFYIAGTSFAMASMYYAVKFRNSNKNLHLFISIFYTLFASLNHQGYSFIGLAILIGIIVVKNDNGIYLSFKLRLNRALKYGLISSFLGIAMYYTAFLISHQSSFIQFIRGYTSFMLRFPEDVPQLKTPLYIVIGILRTIFFSEYILSFDFVNELSAKLFPYRLTLDDRFLIRNLPQELIIFLIICSVCVGCIYVWLTIQRRNQNKRNGVNWTLTGVILGVWFVSSIILFGLWEAVSNEFWMWLIPYFGILIIGDNLKESSSLKIRKITTLSIALLFIANTPAITKYFTTDNCVYWINKEYLNKLNSKDVVLTADFYQSKRIAFLINPNINRIDFPIGKIKIDTSCIDQNSLCKTLIKTKINGGKVYLDPMFSMPNKIELGMFRFYNKQENPNEIEIELLKLENFCREHQIPLLAVERKGVGVVDYEKRFFSGYVKWYSAENLFQDNQKQNVELSEKQAVMFSSQIHILN
ncbi:MAG: hypothetical protein IPP08_05605 [Chlorobiota bacterium]|nr:hypothetical protein [Chlorobiota bacterium]QQS67639.1 MAG: hypothetical protein IPP08_05605 [Chlorobiota bacterium]